MVAATTVLGAAGEHYVMCQLLRRGLIAALAPAGVPNTDIVVTDSLGDRLCAVQVKTRRDIGSDGGWHMSLKHETIESDLLFYAFVDFGASTDEKPTCFIVPSAVVAETIRRSHETWLATPGKNGKPHKDTGFRRFLPDYDKMNIIFGRGPGWLNIYRENWSQIESSANKVTPPSA